MRESLRIDSSFMGAGMPKAYSRDLRERVITAVETGASRRARQQSVSRPRGVGGKVAAALVSAEERRPEAARRERFAVEEFAVEILDLIAQRADLTLVETVAELRKTDQNQPQLALAFSDRHNITLKKVLQAAERQ